MPSLRRRHVAVLAWAAAVCAALFVVTLAWGSTWVSPDRVIVALFAPGHDPAADFVVRELRLPTAAAALAVGVAFGLSGSLFQRLLANPLASPDIVGISSGAGFFAVASLVLFKGMGIPVSVAALLGALVSASAIYLLAWRGGVRGFRFVLVGIGVHELMFSLTGYLIARADLFDARAAMSWLVGSVGQTGSRELLVLSIGLAVLVPAALLLSRTLGVLELGDDAARGLGVRVEWARVATLAVAIVLVALATAAAGPIPFVALMAGPIALRLLGSSGTSVLAPALVGAAIVLAADLVANHLMPTAMPTGVVTGLVGAPYLVWLLIRVNREGRGG